MTRDQFIAAYCERSGVMWNHLSQFMVALPCACGELGCNGWAMVLNDPLAIELHEERSGVFRNEWRKVEARP
jgi:hypothetical protein